MRTRRLIVVTPEGDRELLFIGRLTLGRAPVAYVTCAVNAPLPSLRNTDTFAAS